MKRKTRKESKSTTIKRSKNNQTIWINELPDLAIIHILSFLPGVDAIHLGQCLSSYHTTADDRFWKILGQDKLEQVDIRNFTPDDHDDVDVSELNSSDTYKVFSCQIFNRLMTCYNCQSFMTYSRLISFSSHKFFNDFPCVVFFQLPDIQQFRTLNVIERTLFQPFYNQEIQQRFQIIKSTKEFLSNLNKKFFFSSIQKSIDFSLFFLAGGSVLNCMLVTGFDHSQQDLDFFWKGGSLTLFNEAIIEFKTKLKHPILNEQNINDFLTEFVIKIDEEHVLKIQFVFGRKKRSTISFVLNTFDIDIVQVAFDGTNIISTLAFYQAIRSQTFIAYNVSDAIEHAPYFVERCLKYHSRGFTWLCPKQFDEFIAQKPLMQKATRFDYDFNNFYFNYDRFHVQQKFLSLSISELRNFQI